MNVEIPQMYRIASEEIDIAEDSAEAEHVLIFKIAAVTPSVNLYSHLILAGLEVWGDIELSIFCRSLAVADLLSVYPEIHCA